MISCRSVLAGFAALLLAGQPAIAQAEERDYGAMMRAMGMGGLSGKKLEKAVVKADAHPLGSKENPVRVNGPAGQHAYLARLRCADGNAPRFGRISNVGMGVFGNIVDLYDVRCGEDAGARVHMDMYHGGYREGRAVPGFTLAEEQAPPAT